MAIGALIRGGMDIRGAQPTVAASLRGDWITCNDDLETAEAAADLLKPWNISRAAVHWVKAPEGALGVLCRAKNDAAASAVTASPVVRLIGAYGDPNESGAFSGTVADSNFATFVRLDNADAGAAGLTLTLATSGNLEDASYEYSDLPNLTGYSLLSAGCVAMIVETAANVTGGAVYGELLFI